MFGCIALSHATKCLISRKVEKAIDDRTEAWSQNSSPNTLSLQIACVGLCGRLAL